VAAKGYTNQDDKGHFGPSWVRHTARYLVKVLTVLAETTWSDKLFHIGITPIARKCVTQPFSRNRNTITAVTCYNDTSIAVNVMSSVFTSVCLCVCLSVQS